MKNGREKSFVTRSAAVAALFGEIFDGAYCLRHNKSKCTPAFIELYKNK